MLTHGVSMCGILFAFLAFLPGAGAAPALTLAKDGRTACILYHDAGAPDSVNLAAAEIQRVVRLSTGAEIPIKTEPGVPMICLGENAEAARAGVSAASLPEDGFRIATRGGNLYIVGKDLPGDKPVWTGWTSRGTLFGAYDFLERVVGVRWLLPGEWGEDVPRHSALTVPAMDLTETPDFPLRSLVDIQERRPPADKGPSQPRAWLLRQKVPPISDGRKVQHGHAWDAYVPAETLKAHPEYLAVSGDKNKYCTSNEELTQTFAQGVIQWLDEHPTAKSAAISPADGGGFCQCPKCKALVTTDPHGRPSNTLLLLDFHNRIARSVAQKHPDRILGCYVYYNYMYPPEKPVKIEPNLYLVWAPLNYYGWGLQKPVYRDEFRRVLSGWTALTKHFVYHNYSTWMRSFNGAPLPPAFDILTLELPALKKAGVFGVEMVGLGAWGYGAPNNYLLAKQMWDADVDVRALYREWLQRAYGPGWPAMDRLYRMVEARMKERKEKESPVYRGEMYEVNYDLIEKVHLPIFAEMERLYREALAKAETEAQRKRLEMLGDNLVWLHHDMRKAGMPLPDPEKSLFYRTDEEFAKFLAETDLSLSLYRDHGKRNVYPIWKGEWSG